MGIIYNQSIVSVLVSKIILVLLFVPSRSSLDPPSTESLIRNT